MDQKANHTTMTEVEAFASYKTLVENAAVLREQRFSNDKLGNQVREFSDWLCTHTAWLTAPASSKFHLCVKNGLLIHSVVVARTAQRLAATLMPDLPLDSVIICALWHDLGKVWGGPQVVKEEAKPGKPARVLVELAPYYSEHPLRKDGTPAATPYQVTGNPCGINSATNSIRLIEKFIDLTDGEAQAILGHDGQYIPHNRDHQHKEHPLTLITHTADMWTGHVTEGNIQASWQNEVPFSRLIEELPSSP